MLKEFRKFILKGDLVTIAVGLILALQVSALVTSLTDNVIMQIVAAIFGTTAFFDVSLTVNGAEITYGAFLNSVITFLIIGFILFLIVKAYNAAKDKLLKSEDPDETPEDIQLLREIRDALQKD